MNCRLFLCILFLFPLVYASAQGTSLTEFIDCMDSQNGADNLLVNGRPYLPSHPGAEGHPFFQTNEWRPGTIYVKGRSFPVDELKYSLFNDQLLLKHRRSNGVSQNVALSEFLVDSFQIEEHMFVNRALILPEQENISYLEKFYGGKLSFYRFQQKVLGPITTFAPHGRFSDLKDEFFLILDDENHEINKRRDFLACFPDHKKEIKKYMRMNSMRWRNMTKPQYIQLLKFCDDQI